MGVSLHRCVCSQNGNLSAHGPFGVADINGRSGAQRSFGKAAAIDGSAPFPDLA